MEFEKYVSNDKRFYVYVAGPISRGSWDGNMIQATRAFNMFVYAGLVPFVPHATTLLNHVYVSERVAVPSTDDYTFWLDYDFAYLRDVADVMLRMPGESWGTDREEEYMDSMGKPVFYTVEAILDCAESRGFKVNREAAFKFAEEFDAVYQS